ncbi:DUF624 domain-containing protein [Heyndrickxia oleronia]|uniref:YesL family protein n=1 Tax=Heyndrickxia oleronia TaxID=38875 RepID=UPI002040E9E4|nr:DUF624 domain-containing protein [Heyndrickxia oleronia]MCM3238542.1 DUF624 domain-containing protein [Heyndrickxia oleronia]
MFKPEGKLYRIMEFIGNFCLLNILWIICSLPLITIFASTTAMYGVIRDWSKNDDPAIIKTFFLNFKKYFMKSLIIGILQSLIMIILVSDFLFVWNMDGTLKYILFPLFIIIGLFFLFISSYLYPLVVDDDRSLKQLIKQSVYLAVTRPAYPTMVLLFASIAVLICTYIHVLPILFAFSITGLIHYQIIQRGLGKRDNTSIRIWKGV